MIMRLLVLGAGGVGGYFAARLAAAGVDVTFLVRPSRAERLARDGLTLLSPLGNLRQPVAALSEVTSSFDAVLLTCKAYDLNLAMEVFAPAIGPTTIILPLLNGLRHLDDLDARFGSRHVVGGLCHIGATVAETGEIQHLNGLQRLAFGPRTPSQAELCETLHVTLSRGGFAPVLSPEILQEMWEKFVMLAAYAGMTCLMRAPIGRCMQADDGEALVLELLAECAGVASASGYAPDPAFLAGTRAMLTDRGSAGAASMLRDIERRGRTEGEHVLGDLVRRAKAVGMPTPLLRIARAHLQTYEAGR